MRKHTEQTKAAGVMSRRSVRLFDAKLPTVFSASREKATHDPTRTVAGCPGNATTPVLASTIHAARANGMADRALANRRRRGKTRCAPPHAARPKGSPNASRTCNAPIRLKTNAATIDASIAVVMVGIVLSPSRAEIARIHKSVALNSTDCAVQESSKPRRRLKYLLECRVRTQPQSQ